MRIRSSASATARQRLLPLDSGSSPRAVVAERDGVREVEAALHAGGEQVRGVVQPTTVCSAGLGFSKPAARHRTNRRGHFPRQRPDAVRYPKTRTACRGSDRSPSSGLAAAPITAAASAVRTVARGGLGVARGRRRGSGRTSSSPAAPAFAPARSNRVRCSSYPGAK